MISPVSSSPLPFCVKMFVENSAHDKSPFSKSEDIQVAIVGNIGEGKGAVYFFLYTFHESYIHTY